MKKPHNIYRIDIEPSEEHPGRHPTHGWQVRIRRHGKQHTKFFSDDRAGSGAQALVNALVYRDKLLAKLPDPENPLAKSAQARSKTGVVGLSFCMKDDGSGQQKPYVQLSWMTRASQRKTASYSVDKWGLRRAVWNACVRLNRERTEAGQEEPEPIEMFQTAYPKILEQYERDTAGQDRPEPAKVEESLEVQFKEEEAEAPNEASAKRRKRLQRTSP